MKVHRNGLAGDAHALGVVGVQPVADVDEPGRPGEVRPAAPAALRIEQRRQRDDEQRSESGNDEARPHDEVRTTSPRQNPGRSRVRTLTERIPSIPLPRVTPRRPCSTICTTMNAVVSTYDAMTQTTISSRFDVSASAPLRVGRCGNADESGHGSHEQGEQQHDHDHHLDGRRGGAPAERCADQTQRGSVRRDGPAAARRSPRSPGAPGRSPRSPLILLANTRIDPNPRPRARTRVRPCVPHGCVPSVSGRSAARP